MSAVRSPDGTGISPYAATVAVAVGATVPGGPTTGIRLDAAALARRLVLARAYVLAHVSGALPETLAALDAAYTATRLPCDYGESYDGE